MLKVGDAVRYKDQDWTVIDIDDTLIDGIKIRNWKHNQPINTRYVCLGDLQKCNTKLVSVGVLRPEMNPSVQLTEEQIKKISDDKKCEEILKAFKPLKDIATKKQVGGYHYKDFKIQPVEFIHANKLDFCEGNAIKYICRHRKKNGKQDLEKAKHYIELLLELEYGCETSQQSTNGQKTQSDTESNTTRGT